MATSVQSNRIGWATVAWSAGEMSDGAAGADAAAGFTVNVADFDTPP